MANFNLPKFHWAKILSAFFFILLFGAYADIFAIGSKYAPGATLDPACPPGEVNCTVDINTTETDPVFSASTSHGITGTDIINWNGKQTTLSSGTNIKTINSTSLLGSGDISIPVSPITIVNTSNLFSTGLTGTGSGVTTATNSIFLGANAGNSATNASQSNFLGYFAGINATSASNSNFFGNSAGTGATSASASNFIGSSTGNGATYASYSNFLGSNAGASATYASNSNFFGTLAGRSASNARNSVFIGQYAGYLDSVNNTSNGLSSILIGSFTNTGGFSNSILLGSGTSISSISNTKANQFMLAPTVTEMQLKGIDYSLPSSQGGASTVLTNDGSGGLSWAAASGGSSPIEIVNSTNLFSTSLGAGGNYIINNSNFLGLGAGLEAYYASDSNFIGNGAGYGATDAAYSNFLGTNAGSSATSSHNSNFFGANTGTQALYASNSNFLGQNAGSFSTDASYSNFMGMNAGNNATEASNSNFFGYNAGYQASLASNSNFFGQSAGSSATNASNSIFIGNSAGLNDTVDNFSTGGTSILIGDNTNTGGYSNSIALGAYGVNTMTNQFLVAPTYNNWQIAGVDYVMPSFQGGVGDILTNDGSGGLSWAAGGSGSSQWTTTGSDIYYNDGNVGIGTTTPRSKIDIPEYNTTGYQFRVGDFVLQPYSLNNHFFAENTYFDGENWIYLNSGYAEVFQFHNGQFQIENFDYGTEQDIAIQKIQFKADSSGTVAIGGAINYVKGNYTGAKMLVRNDGNVGIGNISPSYTLQVGNNTISGIVARFQNSTGTCDINPTTSTLSCSSDINLKKNITDLNNIEYNLKTIDTTNLSILDKVLSLTPVTYNWKSEGDTDPKHIGFIAQEMEQVFPNLVSTDINTGLKSISYATITPYLVKAIEEMDLKVKDLSSLDTTSATSLGYLVKGFLSDIGNNITDLYASVIHGDRVETKTLCVGSTCVTEEQFLKMVNNSSTIINTPIVDTTIQPVVVPPENNKNDVPPIVTPEKNINDTPPSADDSKTTNDETTTPSIKSSSNTSTPSETPAL